MEDKSTYFSRKMPDEDLSIDIFLKNDIKHGQNFKMHWHEHLQIYYFIEGRAILECGKNRFQVSPGNIALANSNELHYVESLSDDLAFYMIRIAPSFLFSNQVDLLQTKYLAPLALNRIAFRNMIESDVQILDCITRILQEYSTKETGYELAIKAASYQLIVLLLRGYVSKILTENELAERTRNLKRFEEVFQIIEKNYAEKISLRQLADSVNISTYHFCRTFKQLTGKTTTDYINGVRLEKAAYFLEQTNLNITEIAIKCGFDSVNYFSRLFRKYYNTSATKFRDAHTGKFY
ncbi:helix-turn-helix transcriptional regulator [Clostridium oryzae]|uniref:Bifunctional transcriptional activator/DNA repair enzyme AdaA n=1 Tax=Clostridium oryzae TaxID=1450648 RepID=A0A1V4IZQ3_9CLOT|nr:AraC family transcriptional regulator [Clostridium oryzae]OPJ65245.1 bifunctional transcriptional activator/DNA repair enzyme AdaA [Clostridium oryzae]